jgi:mycothiol system anti-sigma-R factor
VTVGKREVGKMQCSDGKMFIHAYLDGELEAEDSVRLMRHLTGCPACSREFERQAQLKQLLQRAKPASVVPDALRSRVLASLALSAANANSTGTIETAFSPPALRLPMHRWRALPTALAASLLLLVGGGLGVSWQRQASDLSALTANLVSNHVRSLQPEHLTDVLTSDRHTVKPWFDGKLDFSPQVRDLSASGFALVGGRLDVLHGRRVAAIVYRRRLHAINLFQWPEAAADSTPATSDAGDGFTITHWTQDGMAYWVVSNLDAGEMTGFATAFRRSPPLSAPLRP